MQLLGLVRAPGDTNAGDKSLSPASNFLNPKLVGNDANSLHGTLSKLVIGQDDAVEQIVNIYNMHVVGLSPMGRPIGNFLFLGPTGSGKTRIVEATAEALLDNPRAVIKIDCAEFQHSHEIAKLIGSPPGYLGHRETHALLSQTVLNQHHTEKIKVSLVLFDEIEKASDALWNLLLGILDKATLTLGDNNRVDFSRAMIFMTSNLGAAEMESLIRPRLGFAAGLEADGDAALARDANKIKAIGVEAARKKFTPEFINRIDKVVVFKPLGTDDLARIVDLELALVQESIFLSTAPNAIYFTLQYTQAVKDFLVEQGFDRRYGARHLKRAITRLLVHPLSNLMATRQISSGAQICVGLDTQAQELTFELGVWTTDVMPAVYALRLKQSKLLSTLGHKPAPVPVPPPKPDGRNMRRG